jgi:hypothetical protein
MKKFKIPVIWQMTDVLEIEANSLEEAKELAYEHELTEGEYLSGSFQIDEDGLAEQQHNHQQ